MRALTEDTKKLSLTNNNNNTRSLTSSKETKIVITKTASTKSKPSSVAKLASVVTQKNSQAQINATKINKTKNMQQQVNSSKMSTTKSVSHSSSTSTGASSKPQKPLITLQQQQQQGLQPTQQQQLKYNNNSHTISLPKASHANTSEEIAGGVQDTIYLCNFRVSVDGEWLCLKELQDIDVGQQTASTSGINTGGTGSHHGYGTGHNGVSTSRQQFNQKNKRFSGLSTHGIEDNGILAIENLIGRRLYDGGSNALAQNNVGLFAGSGDWSNLSRDTAEIERSNLVNICKLVVKELLEQSLRYGRMLDSDHLPLQHFFIVIEHVLGHGLRPKKGLLGPRKELWDLLQSVENYCSESQDITASVRDLPTVRTHIGRARAWLRIALMQKKLADYLQALIEHREDALYDYYEPHALMLSDEIVVIMGILVGLNVIDCNLCVKEEDLDSQQGVIDFSLYLRSSSSNNETSEESNQVLDATGQGNMIAVLDQKNYIEELNRHLNATVANMQAKVESLTTTNALMKEDLAIARNSLLALQAENQAMRQNTDSQSFQSQNATQSDTSSTSGTDKECLESLAAELAKERRRNDELDKELKLQISLKAESDMAMKLLEKDIHEKQDTIVSLRRQLDDIKQINLEMYRKLQECEDELTQKGEMVSRLQTKASQIGNILQSLEKKYESKLVEQHPSSCAASGEMRSPSTRRQQNLQKFEALTKKHKQDVGPPIKRLHLKVDGIPPFNPNNSRKSPSNAYSSNVGIIGINVDDEAPKLETSKTPTSAKSLNEELAEATLDYKPGVDASKSDYLLSSDIAPNL